MGWFFVILVAVIVISKLVSSASSSGQSTGSSGAGRGSGRLEFEAMGPAESINLHGDMRQATAGSPAMAILTVMDITDGEREQSPVICLSHGTFLYDDPPLVRITPFPVPYSQTALSGLPVGLYPPSDVLLCPKRGRRTIKIEVVVEQGHRTLLTASAQRFFDQKSYGYKQGDAMRMDSACRLARLGVCVAGIDGSVDATEAAAAKSFMQEQLDLQECGADVKAAVTAQLRSTLGEIQSGELNVEAATLKVCGEIESTARAGDTETAFELVLKVVAADSRLDPAEANVLSKVVEALGLDDETAERLRDRHLHLAQLACDSEEQMVGIDPTWSDERKRKHIRSEFQKWNGRVTHSDPAKRKEAEERVKMLARCRTKLDKL